MARRIILIKKGMYGYQNVQRIKDSGFLMQCWLPGSVHPRSVLQRPRLIYGRDGLPVGMTQAYFDKKMKELPKRLGWFGGKLCL